MTDDFKGRFLVSLQFGFVGLLILTTNWQQFNGIALGFYCGSFSVAIRAFIVMRPGSFNIIPTLKRRAKLVTSGPYRYIRHPMYVAVFLGCGGLLATNWDVLRLGFMVVLVLVLYIKASMEERILLAAFADYRAFREKTGMFIPWL